MSPKAVVRLTSIGLATFMALMVGGCPGPIPSGGQSGESKLQTFKSADEFLTFFRRQATRNMQQRSWNFLAAPAAAGGAAAAEDSSVDATYSTTNLQEQGVDESDVFKSDGRYFYIARAGALRIVQAAPVANLAEVGHLKLDHTVSEMYLNGAQLITLGAPTGWDSYPYPTVDPGMGARAQMMMWPPYYAEAKVIVTQVDISDPTAPAVLGQNELDGTLVSSRLIAGRLYLVLTQTPPLPSPTTAASVATMGVNDIVPHMKVAGGAEPLLHWSDYYYPTDPDGYYTTAVVTLDATNVEHAFGAKAIMANAGTIYASQEALYVTDDDYDAANDYRPLTSIHKFVFGAEAGARYVGSGSVPGRLLNQFSLGEYDGFLRVATHVPNFSFLPVAIRPMLGFMGANADVAVSSDAAPPADDTSTQPPPNQPFNAVFVLAPGTDKLDVVGTISNIAPGERLYAARFLGPRGFLVTFQQIDPLFVLDLADPASPQIVGELKIPGYSDYLHPIGNNLLLGIGRSTEQTQWGGVVPSKLQLSLFDLTDPANPTVVQQLSVGGYGSSSDVSWSHKAFTFLQDQGRLALPAQLTPETATYESYAAPEFDGVLCYDITAAGFTARGGLRNVDAMASGSWWYGGWHRAAFIGDTLYAVTPGGVSAAPLSALTTRTELELQDLP